MLRHTIRTDIESSFGIVEGGIVEGGIVEGGIVEGGFVEGGFVEGGFVEGGIGPASTALSVVSNGLTSTSS